MQFLVYLTVLMFSISAVLLEVHWLTSPSPQPKPAVQASRAPAPAPKAEGPNAALSPVYPKPPETPRSVDSGNIQQAQTSTTSTSSVAAGGTPGTTGQAAPVQQHAATTAAAPAQQQPVAGAANAAPPQRAVAETTGVATRDQDRGAMNGANRINTPQESAAGSPAPNNRCDVQACSSAYRSFRASDCTDQPFEGERRFCGKPPLQRTAREQREEPERRRWGRGIEPPPVAERRVQDFDDDDDGTEFSEPARDLPSLFLFGRRSRW